MDEKDLLEAIDEEIRQLVRYLGHVNDLDAYKNGVAGLKVLTETRESILKERQTGNWLKPELIIPVVGVLAEIVLVMNHERLNVIATKIWSRIGR